MFTAYTFKHGELRGLGDWSPCICIERIWVLKYVYSIPNDFVGEASPDLPSLSGRVKLSECMFPRKLYSKYLNVIKLIHDFTIKYYKISLLAQW